MHDEPVLKSVFKTGVRPLVPYFYVCTMCARQMQKEAHLVNLNNEEYLVQR